MKRFITVLSAVFLVLIVFAKLLTAPFLWDDEAVIVINNFVTNMKNISYLFDKNYFTLFGELSYRPVVTLSHILDSVFLLKKSVNHHFMNLLFHCFNVVLVYMIMVRNLSVSRKKYLCFCVPVLFGVFAWHTEVLAVVSYRDDILMTFFLLIALRNHLIGGRCYVSVIALLLSLFSKETALVFLPVVVVLDYLRGSVIEPKFLRRYIGIILVYIFYIYVRFFLMVNPDQPYSESYFVSAVPLFFRPFITLFAGLGVVLAPFSIRLDYNEYAAMKVVVSYGIVFAVLMTIFFKPIICDKTLRFTGLLTVVSLLPVMNFYPLENIFATRYLYLPSIGIALFLVRFVTVVCRSDRICMLVLLSIILFMSCCGLSIQGSFFTQTAFAKKMVADTDKSYRGYNYLGTIKDQQGDIESAKKYYRRALSINPYYYESCYNLAFVFMLQNNLTEAVNLSNRLIALNGLRSDGYRLMGNIMLRQGAQDKAVSFYETALEKNSYDLEARNNLGTIFEAQNRLAEASEQYTKVLKIDPKYDLAWSNLGNIGIKRKDYQSAQGCYLKALSIVSDNDKTWYNLGNAYFHQEKMAKAERAYKQSLILNPLSSETLYNLAVLYVVVGKKEDAVRMLDLYVRLKPNDKDARRYLKMLTN